MHYPQAVKIPSLRTADRTLYCIVSLSTSSHLLRVIWLKMASVRFTVSKAEDPGEPEEEIANEDFSQIVIADGEGRTTNKYGKPETQSHNLRSPRKRNLG